MWFWHCLVACKVAGLKPGFLFVMDPSEEPLATMIRDLAQINGVDVWVAGIQEEVREDKREWNAFRYEKMVNLRNVLLDAVRRLSPPLFLSLDSDILLHADSIESMVEKLEDFDAIGGKAYMTSIGTSHPSYGMLQADNMLRRQDADYVITVDVIMAIKLMTPSAYAVDYRWASQGEDIGWSQACGEKQLKFRWDGTVVNKHVMRREELERVDVRAGY